MVKAPPPSLLEPGPWDAVLWMTSVVVVVMMVLVNVGWTLITNQSRSS